MENAKKETAKYHIYLVKHCSIHYISSKIDVATIQIWLLIAHKMMFKPLFLQSIVCGLTHMHVQQLFGKWRLTK